MPQQEQSLLLTCSPMHHCTTTAPYNIQCTHILHQRTGLSVASQRTVQESSRCFMTHFLEASSQVTATTISPGFIISRKISKLLLSETTIYKTYIHLTSYKSMEMKWNQWRFRLWPRTCKAILNWGHPGLMGWILSESCPWCRIDRSTCWSAVHRTTTVPWMPSSKSMEISLLTLFCQEYYTLRILFYKQLNDKHFEPLHQIG